MAADGSVLLAQGVEPPHHIWLLDQSEEKVLRVATDILQVVGAYRTGARPGTDDPTAVAVDGEGNAYVVNSSPGLGPTTLTRILNTGCPDDDGDGHVETAVDDDALDWGEDECVDWNVEVEEDCDGGWSCGYGRSIALTDRGRFAWIALYGANRVVEVDAASGELTGRAVDVTSPIGLASDGAGNIWVAAYTATVTRFTQADPEQVDSFTLRGQDGISSLDVDAGGRLFVVSPLASFDAETEEVYSAAWTAYDVAIDADGYVWGAGGWGAGGNALRRYDDELSEGDSFSVSITPFELAADLDGHVWAASQWGEDAIVLVDAATGDDLGFDLAGCGDPCLRRPVLEGDPTGMRFRRAFGGSPAGASATVVFDTGCQDGWPVNWHEVAWETAGGLVQLSARSAYSVEDLQGTAWVALGSTPPETGAVQPDVGSGWLLEVMATLRGTEPRLLRVTVEWDCLQRF